MFLIREAEVMKFVQENHNPNQLYGDYPYFFHLYQVNAVAKEFGFNDENILLATFLHDVLEDAAVSFNDIVKLTNRETAEIVYAVTDELGRSRKEKHEKTYPKIKMNEKATVVKLCDRLANVRFSIATKGKLDMYLKENYEFIEAIFNEKYISTFPLWLELYHTLQKENHLDVNLGEQLLPLYIQEG